MQITIETAQKEQCLKLLTMYPQLEVRNIEDYNSKTGIFFNSTYENSVQAIFNLGFELGNRQQKNDVTEIAVENLTQMFLAAPFKTITFDFRNIDYMVHRQPIIFELQNRNLIRVIKKTMQSVTYEYISEVETK